jgi:aminoglycoside phosphotransferase (APT) family kinase protein
MHLVHGDFDPANVLVEEFHGTWKISSILDWEFAFSGSSLWDVANMLRYAHLMPSTFQDAFITGLTNGGTALPDHWQKTSYLLNLLSLLDLLKREDAIHQPRKCADIRELINYMLQAL